MKDEGLLIEQAGDVQLEFVMLDPYIRKTLSYNKEKNNGEYSTVGMKRCADEQIIRAPDVYGIYKFRLFYQRQGLSLINENTQVSIRPYKHNEFPRFILAAYPYYTRQDLEGLLEVQCDCDDDWFCSFCLYLLICW